MTFITEYLILPKLLYILQSFFFYTFYYFRPKFFSNVLGIKINEYAMHASGFALCTFVSTFFWGALSDRSGKHNICFMFCVLFAMLSFETIFFFKNNVKWFSLAMCYLYVFFSSATPPLLDKVIVGILDKKNQKYLYGRQRMFGTVAYGMITYSIGHLIEAFGFDFLFIFMGIAASLTILVFFIYVPADSANKKAKDEIELNAANVESELNAVTFESNVRKKKTFSERYPIMKLLGSGDYMFFLFVIFMNGFPRAVMTIVLSDYLEDCGLTKDKSGLTAVFGIAMEVIIFAFSKTFLDFFGIFWMFILAQITMVMRMWAYSFIPCGPQMLLPICFVELLKGANFGFMHAAGVQLAHRVAPKQFESLAQGLYAGTYTGLSAIFAGFFLAFFHVNENALTTFFVVAIISTFALVLFIIKYGFIDKELGISCSLKKQENVQV